MLCQIFSSFSSLMKSLIINFQCTLSFVDYGRLNCTQSVLKWANNVVGMFEEHFKIPFQFPENWFPKYCHTCQGFQKYNNFDQLWSKNAKSKPVQIFLELFILSVKSKFSQTNHRVSNQVDVISMSKTIFYRLEIIIENWNWVARAMKKLIKIPSFHFNCVAPLNIWI